MDGMQVDGDAKNSAGDSSGKDGQPSSIKEGIIAFAQVLPLAILFALLVKTFLFQSFFIPSESMLPSLQVGDHLFVSKYRYGYSKYSLPFSTDMFAGRIMASTPQRGDVAVFHMKGTDYIKRVMGLPGDRIKIENGIVSINGVALERKQVKSFVTRNLYGYKTAVPTYLETLPNRVTHRILELTEHGSGDNTGLYVVPGGHYFMMGDNRDNSSDSRFNAPLGFIPFENFVGRANLVYFSLDRDVAPNTPVWEKIRWSRIFKWIL